MFSSNYSLDASDKGRENLENLMNIKIADARKDIKEVHQFIINKENNDQLNIFNKNFETYASDLSSFLQASKRNDKEEAQRKLTAMTESGSSTIASLDVLTKRVEKDNNKIIADAEHQSANAAKQIIIVSILAELFCIVVAFIITRRIRRSVVGVIQNVDITTESVMEIKKLIDETANKVQILEEHMHSSSANTKELLAFVEKLASDTNGASSSIDEISAAIEQAGVSGNIVASSADTLSASAEQTSSAIQEMMTSIEQVALNVSSAGATVDQISAAIEEMSKSIKGVSKRAESLTDDAEQTADAVEEMVVSIKQIAESAQTVNQLSNTVQDDALEGTESLNKTLHGMKEISLVINQASEVMVRLGRSSDEIGMIIQVIDDIADQTNLLALNAAIEAARAGEHGKGFAVVAEEVRKLAERSAQATKEISKLIKGIQEETSVAVTSIKDGADKVKVGNQLAEKTTEAIQKIVKGIAHVTEEMNQIAKATEEQTRNSEMITLAVENVKKKASEMTHSTKEQSITAEEMVKGISGASDQVQQISIATAEQAKGIMEIVEAAENVTNQSNTVKNATREQSITEAEIVRNINSLKEMTGIIVAAARHQLQSSKEMALEIENDLKQAEELNKIFQVQTKQSDEVVKAITEVNNQIDKIK